MNLKEFLNNNLHEGGAAGHMLHPYDRFDNPDDMLEFFERFLSGQIKGTEKVDGFNLFASVESNKAVAVRNKNELPIKDINKKFGLNHPAHNGFTAGWTAIKEKLESLTTAEIKQFNLEENFINMEVIYGYIPNAVPYSQTTNYIVFHGFMGNPDNNWSPVGAENQDEILKKLAKKFGTMKVTSPNVTFSGDPDNVKREIKDVESEWQFYGPIEIPERDIKKQLRKVTEEWRNYSEVKALVKFAKEEDSLDLTSLDVEELKAHQEKKFQLMKSATKKIGTAILSSVVSRLSDTGEVVPGYPGIEGIVTKQGGDLVKITGDFLDYSRPDDSPALDATKNLRILIQKEILGLTVTTLKKVKSKEQMFDYILSRKKKSFTYRLDDLLPDELKQKIDDTIKSSKSDVKSVVKVIQSKGRAYDVKSLLIQTFMLTNIEKQLGAVTTYRDLLDLYGKELYGL